MGCCVGKATTTHKSTKRASPSTVPAVKKSKVPSELEKRTSRSEKSARAEGSVTSEQSKAPEGTHDAPVTPAPTPSPRQEAIHSAVPDIEVAESVKPTDPIMVVNDFIIPNDDDKVLMMVVEQTAKCPSATAPSSSSPRLVEHLQYLLSALNRPIAEVAKDEHFQSTISSIFREIPEEDWPALGKLESLKQAVSDSVEAKKRNNHRQQLEESSKGLQKLTAGASDDCRVRALKVERATAKADSARARVEELKTQLANAEEGLAMKEVKLKEATSALKAAKAKHDSLMTESNSLVALSKSLVPGNPKDDEAIAATPGLLIADATRVVKKLLHTKA